MQYAIYYYVTFDSFMAHSSWNNARSLFGHRGCTDTLTGTDSVPRTILGTRPKSQENFGFERGIW